MADSNQADSSFGSAFTLQPAMPAQLVSSQGSVQSVTTPGATTSSSEPPQPSPGQPLAVAQSGLSPSPSTVRGSGPSTAPNSVRPAGNADAQLNDLLQAQDQAAQYGPARDRSRNRDRSATPISDRFLIGTPRAGSRDLTPPLRRTPRRQHPVTPSSSSDQVGDLRSELFELKRQLRLAERNALEHRQAVEQQATAAVQYTEQEASVALAQARSEHEAAMIQFREWGGGAKEEIDSLLNSLHASTLGGQESDAQVADLRVRLQHAESVAEQAHGRHLELHQAVSQVRIAELQAASDAQLMEVHAQHEAMAARQLKAEMQNAHTATDRLRGTLSELEGQAELREADRLEMVAYQASLDQNAAQLTAEFAAREQQLMQYKQALVVGQEQNAAEKRELAFMLQECRMPPASAPQTPRAIAPPQVPPLPGLPAPSTPNGGGPTGIGTDGQALRLRDSAAQSMTVGDHERRLRATIGPLEERLNKLQAMYESERKDKKILLEETDRLNGLVDIMQSEAREAVSPLPSGEASASRPRADSGTPDVVESVAEAVIHHLAVTGVIGGGRRIADGHGEATETTGGDGASVAGGAEAGVAEEPRPTAGRSHAAGTTAPAAAPAVRFSLDHDPPADKDRKWKRPSPVNVPAFPTVAQMSQWQRTVARALVAASVYDDKAEVAWFKRASETGVTFEDLADVGEERFMALDQLLCQALMKKLPADLNQRIRRKEDEAWKRNTTITGLQVTWMIYDYFKTDDHMSQVYGLHDLTDIPWFGDNRMLDFLQQWDFVLDNIEGDTRNMLYANGEKTLRDLLFRQVEKSAALAEDIAHYKRVGLKHPDRSYAFLRDAIERFVKNAHQRKITEERRNAIRSGKNTSIEVPALPAKDDGGSVPAVPSLPADQGNPGSGGKGQPKRGRSKKRNGGDGGNGGDGPTKKNNLKDVPCYFHSAARYGAGQGCYRGNACPFSHSLFIKREEFDTKERPRSASASKGGGKGGGKGRSRSASKRLIPFHCNKFLKDGVCPTEKEGKTCKYPHLNQEQYDAEAARLKAAAAAAKK